MHAIPHASLCPLLVFAAFNHATVFAQETVVAEESAAEQPQLTAERLFDPTHLVRIEIEMPKADWDKIRNQTRAFADSLGKTPAKKPYGYVKGTITIDGVRIEGVGIRKKGFLGSLATIRPSLKVKFCEFKDQSPVKGLDRLTLNNNKQDRSQISQTLSYRLFREAGVIAPRCNHARVVVNGKLLGVYSHVESIKAPFLQRGFGDSSGDLFEGTVADLFPDRLQKFELKTPQTKLEPLTRLAAAMAKDELDLEEIGRLLDIDAFLKFWATESLISFWDGYTNNQNNYFLYKNPKNQKLYFIPWGVDAAFQTRMPLPPYRIPTPAVQSQAVLANKLYRMPAIQKRYRQTMEGLLASIWNEDKLLAEVDRVEVLLKDHLHKSQRSFPRALQRMRSFLKSRRRSLQKRMKPWPVEFKSGPRKPFYFKHIGTATATFSTKWNNSSPAKPLTHGDAKMELQLEGRPVLFKQLGVSAELSKMPTQDGSPRPPTIVFSGTRKSDGKLLVVAFSPALTDFRPTGDKSVLVQGVVIEGRFGFLNPMGWKMMSGQVKFEEAAMKPGAAVRGEVTLKIVKSPFGK